MPDVETVTRATGLRPGFGESGAAVVTGYSGPPSRTLRVAALWRAMRQFIADSPRDPVNLIF